MLMKMNFDNVRPQNITNTYFLLLFPETLVSDLYFEDKKTHKDINVR